MTLQLPDFNEPRMQALLDHLKNPRPPQRLRCLHGQWVLQDIVRTQSDSGSFFALTDIYAYTFDEVKYTEAHLAVLGHA